MSVLRSDDEDDELVCVCVCAEAGVTSADWICAQELVLLQQLQQLKNRQIIHPVLQQGEHTPNLHGLNVMYWISSAVTMCDSVSELLVLHVTGCRSNTHSAQNPSAVRLLLGYSLVYSFLFWFLHSWAETESSGSRGTHRPALSGRCSASAFTCPHIILS